MVPAPASKTARLTSSIAECGDEAHELLPPRLRARTNGRCRAGPSASAARSLRPPGAESRLVCAAMRAMSALMSWVTSRPSRSWSVTRRRGAKISGMVREDGLEAVVRGLDDDLLGQVEREKDPFDQALRRPTSRPLLSQASAIGARCEPLQTPLEILDQKGSLFHARPSLAPVRDPVRSYRQGASTSILADGTPAGTGGGGVSRTESVRRPPARRRLAKARC